MKALKLYNIMYGVVSSLQEAYAVSNNPVFREAMAEIMNPRIIWLQKNYGQLSWWARLIASKPPELVP